MNEIQLREELHRAGNRIDVPPMPEMATRKDNSRVARWLVPIGVAACIAIGIQVADQISGANDAEPGGPAAASTVPSPSEDAHAGTLRTQTNSQTKLAAYLKETGGGPFILPERLPEGFSWFGPLDFSGFNGIDTRSSVFAQPGFETARVTVCASTRSDAAACPQGDSFVDRELGELTVRISFTGGDELPEGTRAFWENVTLSGSPDVSWLPRG